MGQQGRQLDPAVAVAVQVGRSVGVGDRSDAEMMRPEDRPNGIRAEPVHGRPIGQARVVERLRLDDPDVARLAPQPGRAVEGAAHDRDDQDHQRRAEPPGAEDTEDLGTLEQPDEVGAEERIVPGVELAHRRGVVGRRPECEPGQLLDDHADEAHQQQDHDLGDGHVDRGQQPPDRAADPAQRVRATPGDGPLGRDGGDDVP